MTDWHENAKKIAPDGATHYFLHKQWEHNPSFFMLNNGGWFQYILGDWRRCNYDPARNYKIRRID